MRGFMTKRLLLSLVCLLVPAGLLAQGAAATADSPAEPQRPAASATVASGNPGWTHESDRFLHLMPKANDVADAAAPHQELSAADKFDMAANRAFDRWFLVNAAFRAGIGQALDKPQYGQGGEGYAKRFGASVAGAGAQEFFAKAAFPAMFHQDPRYFRLGTGTKGHRLGYALSRVFITRNDSGRSMFNFSLWMGSIAAAGVADTYLPERNRTVAKTMARAGLNLLTEMGFNVMKEFWSHLRQKK